MFLSIIVPSYNEENIIKNNLSKIFEFFSNKVSFEIIVVNDGSTDKSKEILNSLDIDNLVVINNSVNVGKGASIREGVKRSNGELILVTDADLSTSIDQFYDLYDKYLEGYKVIIGSRSTEDASIFVKQPITRIIAGRVFNVLLRILLGLNFKDTQCGFKLFDGQSIKKIMHNSKINRFCIDAEILFIAKKLNLKIYEKGIRWENSRKSSLNLVSDSLNMFYDIFRIKFTT